MSELELRIARVDELRRQIDAARPLDPEQEARIFQKFRLWWNYHSNAIEGNALTLGETATFLMEGLTAKGKPLKDHLDIRGHNEAIGYLLDFVQRKEVVTEAAIRELHKLLLVEPYWSPAETPDGQKTRKLITPGEYKTEANHVRTPTGEVHFYARPEETPARMGDLMAWYRTATQDGKLHAVEIAARFHHEFTAVHPFDDGNGRMSRLLMNLLLMEAGYPPVVIRNGERNAYLAALSHADQGEMNEFVLFIADHLILGMDLFLRGARGEEISEPTDLEKEIALLKREMPPIGEPIQRSPDLILQLLRGSIAKVFDYAAHHLSQLEELFMSTEVRCNRIGHGSHKLELRVGAFDVDDEFITKPGPIPLRSISVIFTFRGLRQTQDRQFDVSGAVDLVLDDWSYRIRLQPSHAEIVAHDYVTQLTEEEVRTIGEKFVRQYVDAMRAWSVKHQG